MKSFGDFLANSFTEVEFRSHSIHPCEVYSCMTVGILTIMEHYRYLILEYFYHPKKKTHTHQLSLPIFS